MKHPAMSPLVLALALLVSPRPELAILLQSHPQSRSSAPTQPRTQSPSLLQNNTVALLCGLTGEFASLNGKKVSVMRFDEGNRRYTVRTYMPPGVRQRSGRASVDAANLVPVPPNGTAEGKLPSCPGALTASAPAVADGAHSMAAHVANTHPVVDNDIFFSKCSQACDDCIADFTWCEAICHEGCQQFCEKVTAGMPGCSTDGYWSARPGSGTPKGCTWDHGENSCAKYRNCNSDDADSCPEWHL
mmetsp:Transcript_138541/g.386459  ORF Transcript_138541/g.386459 Transcript_138541/m.386459 type:complete len:245 (+) Transcript_138541:48-782(+)